MLGWFHDGNHDKVTEHLLNTLRFFNNQSYSKLAGQEREFLNLFLHDMLYMFTLPSYRLNQQQSLQFILQNPLICNLVAMSNIGTTDQALELILTSRHTNNVGKVLTLYSPRNTLHINISQMLDANPYLTNIWYGTYCGSFTSVMANEHAINRLREHLTNPDERLDTLTNQHWPYFGMTYVDHVGDRHRKKKINESIQTRHVNLQIRNTSSPGEDKPKIAVFSDRWNTRSSVYRNQAEFLETLQDDYHLTLVHAVIDDRSLFDTSIFDDFMYIGQANSNAVNLQQLIENDFRVAYYPDVGMSPQSISLANVRLAPIQMCGVGHSVSTFGSLIDYYLSGEDVERAENPEDNYSERLMMLPGYGIIHNQIEYEPTNPAPDESRFLVNCPWYSQKTNYEMLLVLKEILEESDAPLHFQMFPGSSSTILNGHISFAADVEQVLGKENVTVFAELSYEDYMARMEMGEITIDAFPFGGCNTVADSLHIAKPTVTWEGESWYNRIGSAMLRDVGLEDWIATNRDEYIELVLELIANKRKRQNIVKKLGDGGADAAFANESKKHFKAMFDYVVANHEALVAEGKRSALRIDAKTGEVVS